MKPCVEAGLSASALALRVVGAAGGPGDLGFDWAVLLLGMWMRGPGPPDRVGLK
jgi:hypothetical protein